MIFFTTLRWKIHQPFSKPLFAALIYLLSPFILQNFKKILRADIVTGFYNFWDKLGKIWRKSLEQIHNILKISKIHCHHSTSPPQTLAPALPSTHAPPPTPPSQAVHRACNYFRWSLFKQSPNYCTLLLPKKMILLRNK